VENCNFRYGLEMLDPPKNSGKKAEFFFMRAWGTRTKKLQLSTRRRALMGDGRKKRRPGANDVKT